MRAVASCTVVMILCLVVGIPWIDNHPDCSRLRSLCGAEMSRERTRLEYSRIGIALRASRSLPLWSGGAA